MISSWPPSLPDQELDELVKKAIDWATGHGLITKQKNGHYGQTVHAPLALFPTPYPASCYHHAKQLQPLFNVLVDRVARDHAFLTQVIISKVDEFTKELFSIYSHVQSLPHTQPIWFGLHRSDYLLHKEDGKDIAIQQVELNTIASSFGGLSTLTSDLHRYLAQRTDFFNSSDTSTPDIKLKQLPRNKALEVLAGGLGRAWELYNVPSSVVVMVVQPGETNIYDQRLIEYELLSRFGVKLMRYSLQDIIEKGKLAGHQRRLFLDGHEVAVVYFRAGYGPGDYHNPSDWSARLLIEQSFAIKCPNIAYHLAGCKKVQQVLAEPGKLERFFPGVEGNLHVEALRCCFTGLYPVDQSAEGIKAAELALQQPEKYVLKPQREGGGNNFYGQDILTQLKKLSPDERNAFILMDLIFPPPLKNSMVRNGEKITGEVVSELGIYGAYISDGNVVYMNEGDGHLLRTKAVGSNEGGVAAGFAVLDSPFLI